MVAYTCAFQCLKSYDGKTLILVSLWDIVSFWSELNSETLSQKNKQNISIMCNFSNKSMNSLRKSARMLSVSQMTCNSIHHTCEV